VRRIPHASEAENIHVPPFARSLELYPGVLRLPVQSGPLSYNLSKRFRLLKGQLFDLGPQEAQALVVSLGQMIAAVLVSELVNQQAVNLLGDPALEPLVAEAEQVEIQPARTVASLEVVRRVNEPDRQ